MDYDEAQAGVMMYGDHKRSGRKSHESLEVSRADRLSYGQDRVSESKEELSRNAVESYLSSRQRSAFQSVNKTITNKRQQVSLHGEGGGGPQLVCHGLSAEFHDLASG